MPAFLLGSILAIEGMMTVWGFCNPEIWCKEQPGNH
jgi:hypothetical protein